MDRPELRVMVSLPVFIGSVAAVAVAFGPGAALAMFFGALVLGLVVCLWSFDRVEPVG